MINLKQDKQYKIEIDGGALLIHVDSGGRLVVRDCVTRYTIHYQQHQLQVTDKLLLGGNMLYGFGN